MIPANPTNIKEFYPFAIHIIYAVIITLSFQIAGDIFVPFDSIFTSYDMEVRAFAVLLNYIVVISGWIGYTISISKREHSENWMGTARFIVDLLIVFLVFYLITLTDLEKTKEFVPVFKTYIWLFTIIFIAYIIWDMIKFAEYRNARGGKKVGLDRTRKTAYHVVPLLTLALLYTWVIPSYQDMLRWGETSIWEMLFVFFVIVLILSYRKSKWLGGFARKSRRVKESNTKKI